MNIDLLLENIYPLPDTSKELLKKSITEVKYKKGHILLRADKIEKNIYFIKKGVARAYSYKDNDEINITHYVQENISLVWSNTKTPKPQFHWPERFGIVHFSSTAVPVQMEKKSEN